MQTYVYDSNGYGLGVVPGASAQRPLPQAALYAHLMRLCAHVPVLFSLNSVSFLHEDWAAQQYGVVQHLLCMTCHTQAGALAQQEM